MVKNNLDKKKNLAYIRNKKTEEQKIIKTEILLTPLLVISPLIVGFLLIYDWYIRDFILNELDLFSELMLGFIIIFGNIIFNIPFMKSLRVYSKKK